jgi:hypothetical protein
VGYEKQPGDAGATPVEHTDSPSELAEAARGMAEIADQVKSLREGMRSLRAGMQAQAIRSAEHPTDAQPPMVGELHEAAAALEESAQHLSRAVELVSPPDAEVAPLPESDQDTPMAAGLRALICSLRVSGWSDDEVAGYLHQELDVSDASAAVARAWDT